MLLRICPSKIGILLSITYSLTTKTGIPVNAPNPQAEIEEVDKLLTCQDWQGIQSLSMSRVRAKNNPFRMQFEDLCILQQTHTDKWADKLSGSLTYLTGMWS